MRKPSIKRVAELIESSSLYKTSCLSSEMHSESFVLDLTLAIDALYRERVLEELKELEYVWADTCDSGLLSIELGNLIQQWEGEK